MASSFLNENEAPRDFRVSSTESDGHYTKCMLCYTVKMNFYCAECIRTGNFVHSSMPYADRFAEKQAKLLRVKANRKYILDRCEKLLRPTLKKDTLLTESKQSQDKLTLLRLAIEQRKHNIEEKRKYLTELKNHNNELQLKLPRYQKRVAMLGKHAQHQSAELQSRITSCQEKTDSLAALRRSRIRQLTRCIFPLYMTYDDASDSMEDMEFIGAAAAARARLHVVAPWISTDGDWDNVHTWVTAGAGAARCAGALSLAAQLVALLAWTLGHRLPHPLTLYEYCAWRVSEGGAAWRARRLCACAAALVCAALPPPPACPAPAPAPHPLAAVHALTQCAAADDPALGRACAGRCGERAAWADAWPAACDDHEPEHLTWPDDAQVEEESSSAAAGGGLVTSAAASLASMWRGWTH